LFKQVANLFQQTVSMVEQINKAFLHIVFFACPFRSSVLCRFA